jgi:hypothetical protein
MSLWTITHPSGTGTATLAALGISQATVDFRVMAISTAAFPVARAIDSAATWWAADSLVTLYRDGTPYFTGRVQETPASAIGDAETRTLILADAWQDLEEITYREPWAIGGGTFLYPRAILGRNSAGAAIKTGAQIAEAVAYAITQGAALQVGTIDEGLQLWPSEVRNVSCESVITGELRFHPDWLAWIDHSTSPPTFHARAKTALTALPLDIADDIVESHSTARVERNVPRGVSIVYESANTIDGEVFRSGYIDEAGDTTGRRVIRAMLDLEGMQAQFQKTRIQTRTLPTDAAAMTAYAKKKWPELAIIPDAWFDFSGFSIALAPEDTHPPPINPKAERLTVSATTQLPRELVSGSIEDWMKVRVGRVVIKYDLRFNTFGDAAQEAVMSNFTGTGKTFSVTATNAVTKTYTGCSSFTEGEGAPVGLAAAFLAAATEPQYQGSVTTVADEVPAGRPHAKLLTLALGATELMPGAVIHSASVDIERGSITYEFGPLPYLQPGDFLELQRILNRRRPTWMSAQERAANTLGSTEAAGSRGDTVGGYDTPQTIVPPGGGAEPIAHAFYLETSSDGNVILHPGVVWTYGVELLAPTQSASSTPESSCLRVPGLAIYGPEGLIVPTISASPHLAPTAVGDTTTNASQKLYCKVDASAATYIWSATTPTDTPPGIRHYLLGELDSGGVITQRRRSDIHHHVYEIAICDAEP